jgi:radical SAM superfamily enzyme YgiQ (UPF0313 family)
MIYPKLRDILGCGYLMPPLGLLTVAALLPRSWEIRLIDRNFQKLAMHDLDWADVVMIGGMLTQQNDALEIIRIAHARGKPVVVGGPDITSSPHVYSHADFQVRGEAEGVIDEFLAAWNSGARSGIFEAEKFKADVTRSPVPRYDLIKLGDYFHAAVQFARGCPFTCEFCDIIELYGRVPRTKTTPQMLAELDALYALGHRGHVDFVDDNFIGNKKALKAFLPALIAWQQAHGYPFELSTEASVNLADDDELLRLMHDAHFFVVFVGLESPDTDTLISMRKKQNTRRDLVASVRKIYEAGIFVHAGFILGFDSEKGSVAKPMIDYVEAASVPACMIGLLYALPNTQLTRRLSRERRLYSGYDYNGVPVGGDQCTAGLNFATARARRDILADYREVLERVYHPRAYFDRVRRVASMLGRGPKLKPRGVRITAPELLRAFRIIWHLTLRQPNLLRYFWGTLLDCARRNPTGLRAVMVTTAMYLHIGPFARRIIDQIDQQLAVIDGGAWRAPPLAPDAPEVAPAAEIAAAG